MSSPPALSAIPTSVLVVPLAFCVASSPSYVALKSVYPLVSLSERGARCQQALLGEAKVFVTGDAQGLHRQGSLLGSVITRSHVFIHVSN